MNKASTLLHWRPILTSLMIVVLAGCASAPPPAVKGRIPENPKLDTYVIGIPDLLSLTVWEQPDLSGELLVRRDGMVSVALLGDVDAAGLTPQALARKIEEGLTRYVADPRVDVAVVEMRSHVVSVIGGGIQKAGVVELRNEMRVIDAIAEMGGLTPFAKQRQIRVLRGEESYPFDYNAFMRGETPESNFLLAPGDTIVVPN